MVVEQWVMDCDSEMAAPRERDAQRVRARTSYITAAPRGEGAWEVNGANTLRPVEPD